MEIKSFNKHVLNKVTSWIARRSHGPFAIVYHVGRRSGKTYKTPIIPYPIEYGFIAALTYGTNVDWYQNVKSSGNCKILWHGKAYSIHKIEDIDADNALSIYSRFFRFILKKTHTKDFAKLSYTNNETLVASAVSIRSDLDPASVAVVGSTCSDESEFV